MIVAFAPSVPDFGVKVREGDRAGASDGMTETAADPCEMHPVRRTIGRTNDSGRRQGDSVSMSSDHMFCQSLNCWAATISEALELT